MEDQKTESVPFMTQSSQIENFIMWLRNETQGMNYGEVGLTFVVRDNQVVRVNKTTNIMSKAVK